MDIIKVIVLGRGSMKKPKKQREMQNTLMMMHDALAVMKIEIDPIWILCDNESTVDIFKNDEILTNIRKTLKPIEITGIAKVTLEGDLLGYRTVYYHPEVAVNILSFFRLSKRFKSVTYNNEIKDAFVLKRDDGSEMEFVPSKEGLYHLNQGLFKYR